MKLTRCKKILLSIAAVLLALIIWSRAYTFDAEKATKHLTENALSRSHTCCAWFVMRAMQAGGCPAIILPAWAYKYYLPLVQFKEIPKENYVAQKGDIVVFPSEKGHFWGHIAMYNGKQWISDFKQKGIFVAKAYYKSDYRYYRFQK